MRDVFPIYPSSMNGLGHLLNSQAEEKDPRATSAFRTTYGTNYMGTHAPPAPSGRVKSSRLFPPPANRGAVNSSIYQHDYTSGSLKKEPKLRCGTSSGMRKNNPHPHNMIHASNRPDHTVVIWNHYPKLPPLHQDELHSTSDVLLEKFCKARAQSTYQNDYLRPAKEFFGGTPPVQSASANQNELPAECDS